MVFHEKEKTPVNCVLSGEEELLGFFGLSDEEKVAAAANAWNPSVSISAATAKAFLQAYHNAVINAKLKPPTPTDGSGATWDTATFNWLSTIAPTIPMTVSAAMACMAALWAQARSGNIGHGTWSPTKNIFQTVTDVASGAIGDVTKSANTKVNILIFGALALGAFYIYSNKRK